MEYHWGIPVLIFGVVFSLAWAWNKIKKLEIESRDHFKQIDKLENEVAFLRMKHDEQKEVKPLIQEGDVDRGQ